MIRVVFFGSPDFAVPSLVALAHDERFKIEAVVTQPDKPKGRSLKLQQTPVAEIATQLGLLIIKTNNLKDNNVTIQQFNHVDIFVVVAYGALLPSSLLKVPKYGALNLHPSLLPQYRGPSPIQSAILNGDHDTGVTIMLLDEEMDHGPILWQKTVPIEHHDTAESLLERLSGVGAKLLKQTIPWYLQGTLQPQPQDHAKATFTKQIQKEDGRIDWTKPADYIARMVRAYHPWPGTWTTFEHKEQKIALKILKSSRAPLPSKGEGWGEGVGNSSVPGIMVRLSDGSCVVLCGNQTFLHLDLVQPAGSIPMTGEAFLNGYHAADKLISPSNDAHTIKPPPFQEGVVSQPI